MLKTRQGPSFIGTLVMGSPPYDGPHLRECTGEGGAVGEGELTRLRFLIRVCLFLLPSIVVPRSLAAQLLHPHPLLRWKKASKLVQEAPGGAGGDEVVRRKYVQDAASVPGGHVHFACCLTAESLVQETEREAVPRQRRRLRSWVPDFFN